jgi:hypothetical protein
MKYYFMQIQFWIGIRNTNLKKWSISSYYHMVIDYYYIVWISNCNSVTNDYFTVTL